LQSPTSSDLRSWCGELWRRARTRAADFNKTAQAYDQFRPGYPGALFDDIIDDAGLELGDAILEIGAGTGIAGIEWARRGFRLLCLEPTAGMAAVARRKLDGFRDVEIMERRFEDWEVDGSNGVKMVFASDAWHWIEPGVGFERAYRALTGGGTLALVWHAVVQYGPPGFSERVGELRHEISGHESPPQLAGGAMGSLPWKDTMESTRFFGEVTIRRHRFSRHVDGPTFVAVSNTYGFGLAAGLDAGHQRVLESAVIGMIDSDYGGYVETIEEGVAYLSHPTRNESPDSTNSS
jgi:SAM-dependent methyltransferase